MGGRVRMAGAGVGARAGRARGYWCGKVGRGAFDAWRVACGIVCGVMACGIACVCVWRVASRMVACVEVRA